MIAETRRQLSSENRKDSFELHEREIDLEEVREETLRERELALRVQFLESLRDEYEDQAVKEGARAAQEEDISKLERFKRWVKGNLVGLSAVVISVAGIITTIIVAGRKAVIKGAQATSKFAKAVANIAKKLGPLPF